MTIFFFSLRFVFLKYADSSDQRDFQRNFFLLGSLELRICPINQSNPHDRKKNSQLEQTFFSSMLFFFARLFLVYQIKSLWPRISTYWLRPKLDRLKNPLGRLLFFCKRLQKVKLAESNNKINTMLLQSIQPSC